MRAGGSSPGRGGSPLAFVVGCRGEQRGDRDAEAGEDEPLGGLSLGEGAFDPGVSVADQDGDPALDGNDEVEDEDAGPLRQVLGLEGTRCEGEPSSGGPVGAGWKGMRQGSRPRGRPSGHSDWASRSASLLRKRSMSV
jgi:hypothetical protein